MTTLKIPILPIANIPTRSKRIPEESNFGGARLQPCRKGAIRDTALAAEVRLSGNSPSILLAVFFLLAPTLLAQAPAAPAPAAPAAGQAAPTPAAPAGQAAAATASRSAAAQSAPSTPPTPQTGTPAQSPAEAYAAGASSAPDPRTPPTSRPGAYTLAQILDMARAKNLTLLAAEQNLRAVRAQELQAAVRANPYFTLYGTNVTLPAEGASNPYAYSAQVSRLFERGNKREWRIDDAKATTAETQAQLDDTVRQTTLTLKTAFTHMLIAKEALELSNASLKDFRHEVEIGYDRYKAGDLGKLDYERLDLQLGSFESDAANDVITLQQASAQLQTLIGVESPNTTTFDITGDIVPPVITQPQDLLVQDALANRPDYRAARFATQAAAANQRLAFANGTTDPTLEAEYDRSGTYNSAGFSINIPLRLFDRNQGNKQTAVFQASASHFTETAARNQVVSDVAQAWVGYTQAKQLSDRFGEHYLDESRDVLSIAQYAFQHGGIALIDYLDALRDARTSTSDALNAYQQTWLAIHQLSAASATNLTP
jgi:cobalt-zinc-cadmium efflux system outer membrane protein